MIELSRIFSAKLCYTHRLLICIAEIQINTKIKNPILLRILQMVSNDDKNAENSFAGG